MIPLTVKLRADGSEFATGVSSAISGLQSRLVQFASAGALVGYLRSIKQMTDEIKDGAEEAGLSAESFQELSYAFRNSGAKAQDLIIAMRNMSKERQAAMEGDEKAAKTLARYGLTFAQVKEMNPDEMFMAVGKSIAAIDDPMTRNAAALEMFGKSGTKLVQGLKEIDSLRKESQKKGFIISQSDINRLDMASDKLDNIIAKIKIAGAKGLLGLSGSTDALEATDASRSQAYGEEYGQTLGPIMAAISSLSKYTPLQGMVKASEDAAGISGRSIDIVNEARIKEIKEKMERNAKLDNLGASTDPFPTKEKEEKAKREAMIKRDMVGLTDLQRIGAYAPISKQETVVQLATQQLTVQKQILDWARKSFNGFGFRV